MTFVLTIKFDLNETLHINMGKCLPRPGKSDYQDSEEVKVIPQTAIHLSNKDNIMAICRSENENAFFIG
jgi:hypothetical protein